MRINRTHGVKFRKSKNITMFNKNKKGDGLFKSVLLAYFILAVHVLLIAGLAILVLFFRGVVNYMTWIFLAGTVIICVSAYLFYRRMKAEGKTLSEMLKNPAFSGRSVEISLLGGMASLKLGDPSPHLSIEHDAQNATPQLESPETLRIREIKELADLLEKKLITLEEYNKAKQQILK